LDSDQLLLLLSHAFIQLRRDRVNLFRVLADRLISDTDVALALDNRFVEIVKVIIVISDLSIQISAKNFRCLPLNLEELILWAEVLLDFLRSVRGLTIASLQDLFFIVLAVLAQVILSVFVLRLERPPLRHLVEEQVRFVFEQIKKNVFTVALQLAGGQVTDGRVFDGAVGAQAHLVSHVHSFADGLAVLIVEDFLLELQGLLSLQLLLLLAGEEEPLVRGLNGVMDEADSVVDVVAVEQPDVLVSHKHALLAEGAHAVAHRAHEVVLGVSFLLGREKVEPLPHGLGLARVEEVLKLR